MKKTISLITMLFIALPMLAKTSPVLRDSLEYAFIDAVKLYSLERFPEARMSLEKIVAADSTFDAAHFYLGFCDYFRGDYERAGKNFRTASALDPQNTTYLESLAIVYSTTGQRDSLVSVYKKELEVAPEKYRDPRIITSVAESFMQSRQDSLAMSYFDMALQLSSGYTPALLGKSQLYGIMGNMPAFFSCLTEFASDPSVEADAKCDYIKQILERISGKMYLAWNPQLDSLVQTCLTTHPKDSSALKLAGMWYYGTDRKEKGLSYYNQWLETYPDSPSPHFARISFLIMDKDWKNVIVEAQWLIDHFDSEKETIVSAYTTMGDAYYSLKKAGKAFACYEKALEIDPENAGTLNNYAYYLSLKKRNLSKAEKMSYISITKEPDNATYLDTYGWILYLQKRYSEAKPYFKHAMIYGGKSNSVILEHFSKVLEALGEKNLADYYKKLSKSKKND